MGVVERHGERLPLGRQTVARKGTRMFYAGIEVTDADSAMAAADAMDEVEEIECPECHGVGNTWDLSYELGEINIECPCCGGDGTVPDGDDMDDWDPEPPTPAAPALALVEPAVRCATCRDTGRVVKPSAWFPGRTMTGFCPDCTPHIDLTTGRYHRRAA